MYLHMKVTMWISKVKNKATGKIYDQLQYEQVVDRRIADSWID